MIKFLITLTIAIGFFLPVKSQEKKDSVIHYNYVKLDFVPFYYDLFENRSQRRIGMEYERYINEKSSVTSYLDIGRYDHYDYIKYYDFFSLNQRMYSIRQNVSIIGFHLIPGYNYYFYKSGKKNGMSFFSSAVMDFSFYKKEAVYYNDHSTDVYSDAYNQIKTGFGLSLGVKKSYGKHFFIEVKTSVVAKIFNYISEDERNQMMSLDALYTSTDYRFWWISNLKAGYAF